MNIECGAEGCISEFYSGNYFSQSLAGKKKSYQLVGNRFWSHGICFLAENKQQQGFKGC
jgi:hypothetical protein